MSKKSSGRRGNSGLKGRKAKTKFEEFNLSIKSQMSQLALEPRMAFDAAAAVTAEETIEAAHDIASFSADSNQPAADSHDLGALMTALSAVPAPISLDAPVSSSSHIVIFIDSRVSDPTKIISAASGGGLALNELRKLTLRPGPPPQGGEGGN